MRAAQGPNRETRPARPAAGPDAVPHPSPGPALMPAPASADTRDVEPAADILVLIAILAAGPAAVEGLARQALRLARRDPVTAWFRAALSIQWVVLGFWLAWGFRLLGGHPRRPAALADLPADVVVPAAVALVALPALGVSAYAQWRLATLARDIRGAALHRRRLIRKLLRPGLALALALAAFGAGPPLVARGAPVLPLLAACVAAAWLGLRLTRDDDDAAAPAAVTTGEMRDRVAALGARAGLALRQLYVLPRAAEREANAFAASNDTVLVTDHLLRHLSRDEVDAVLAHEMAHLARRDPQRMLLALLAKAGAVLGAMFASGSPAVVAAVFLAGTAAFLALCRRFELGADARALALGAAPAALISGLARLGRLNHVPPRWPDRVAWALTHPSLERRAAAVGRRAGLDPGRVAELIAADAPPADRYDVPPVTGKVFSTALKTRHLARSAWTLIAISVLAPALVLTLAGPEAPRAAALVAAMAAAALATAGTAAALSRFPVRAVRRALARRLTTRGLGGHVAGATLVGLAPGSESRIVEGFYVWDVGFLATAPGRLDYAGEETSFTLDPARIEAVDLVSGPPAWRRTRCVRVTWRDDDGAWCTFRLFALGRGAGPAASPRALFEALDAWWRDAPGTAPPRLAFPAPRHHQVASLAPREQVLTPGLAVSAGIQLALAALAAATLGLPFDPAAGAGLLEAVLGVAAANAALVAPALRHREPARFERRGGDRRRAA